MWISLRWCLLMAALAGFPPVGRAVVWAQTARPVNTCVTCHTEIGDAMALPVQEVEKDVHGRRGLSCVSCHGGNPREEDYERSMDPAAGFVGRPAAMQIQKLCGKCHSDADYIKRFNPSLRVDQETEYATSGHGKRVAQGDQKAATCISCHGHHGIKPVKDSSGPVFATHVATTCGRCHNDVELMKSYGLPADQSENYHKSVHAEALLKQQDLSAPTCNDCHGNHGAAPPGIAAVANVCGVCHARQAGLFAESPHQPAFEALGVSDCLACHSNHAVSKTGDHFIGTGPQSICVQCHSSGEAGYTAAEKMHGRLLELDGKINAAEQVLARAARAGMEVSRPRFELTSARDGLINARVVIHNFRPAALDEVISPGVLIAEQARQAGEDAMSELQFRRKGLAFSLVVIALAVLSIYLKIREIEKVERK